MRKVTLTRKSMDASGTFGILATDSGFTCVSLELPWMNDAPDISCIPSGIYTCTWRFSPSHNRNVYHVENVAGRTAVEIHSANIIQQLLGCICLGSEVATFPAGTFPNINIITKGVQHSQQTVANFEADLQHADMSLTIVSPQ